MATQVLQTVIILLAPVFVPVDALPRPLQVTSLVWPTTHAALALRATMGGAPLAVYWPSVAALVALAVVSLALIPRKLEWRST
jgi:ABC-2 type transport system permease protein